MKDGAKKLGVALGLTAGAAVVIGLIYALTKPSEEPEAKKIPVPPPAPPIDTKPAPNNNWEFPWLPPVPWPFPILPQPLPDTKKG